MERALEMYFFTNGKIPAIYEQDTNVEPQIVRCAISGNMAKYIDPLTKLPFDSVNSFRKIREQHQSEQSYLQMKSAEDVTE